MFGDRKKLVMCQACRGLVAASEKTCPLCGRESVPRFRIRTSEKAGGESFFSLLLLAINIVLFVMMAAVEFNSGAEGVSLMNVPTGSVLYDFGGRSIQAIQHGELWRLVTPNFLHIGLTHLMFNSLALYYVGPQVESIFGSQKFILIYLGTGILSNVASFSFGIQGAGASGAIFGLIGLMAAYGHRQGGSFGAAVKRQMLIWAAAGLVFGLIMHADTAAHVGGFIAGAALAYAIPGEEPTEARSALIWNITAIACAVVVVASFAMVAKNYGSSQRQTELRRSYERVARLEQAFIKGFNWTPAAGGDPQQLAAQLRTAATGVARFADIDPQSAEICRRLIDLANKRAALLDSAKTDSEAISNSNSSYDEVDTALKDYLTWWHDRAQAIGIDE